MNLFELQKKAKNLSVEPGIYLMKDEYGQVIYVGKAKNLRNRVKQYFDGKVKQIKVSSMINHVDNFDTIITKSESDAFALECNLIKKYNPKYNILLKDDKNFPYLVINKKDKYPRFSVIRKICDDGRNYFGPYVTYMRVSYLLDIINSVFKLPTCRRNLDKPSKRACIEGEMGRCSMPCTRLVSQQEYNNQISEAIEFLNGKTSNVKKLLKLKMQNFIDKQDFENAIIIRDYLTLIEKIEEKVLTNLPKNADLDLFAYIDNPIRSVIVQFIRGGKMTGQEVYTFEDKEGSDDELFSSFLAQFYKSKQQVPKLILLNRPATYFSKFLQDVINSNAKISCPVKGVKKHLIDNAIIVGQKYLAQNKLKIAQKNKNTQGALDDLAQILGLNKKIWRIECYDISNTFGTNSVASMVVFEGGVPAKKEYRKFKIKTVEGANDFASIAEVMTRRFSHDQSFGATPDLVVIDGGLGQLHAAVNAISKLNVKLEVISLAKKEELIFSTKSNNPIALLKSEPALKLLQRLRDEAHRFAIGYHRTLRQKSMLR